MITNKKHLNLVSLIVVAIIALIIWVPVCQYLFGLVAPNPTNLRVEDHRAAIQQQPAAVKTIPRARAALSAISQLMDMDRENHSAIVDKKNGETAIQVARRFAKAYNGIVTEYPALYRRENLITLAKYYKIKLPGTITLDVNHLRQYINYFS